MRSQILFAAALLSTAALAQKTSQKLEMAPTDRPADQRIELKDVKVVGDLHLPNTLGIIDDGSKGGMVAVVLDRDFRDAIQGNMDRETIERSNGETR